MRIRTIKPEFWQSERLAKASREARLLFVGLWSMADDSGRTRAASRLLASTLFPYDEDAGGLISSWLAELVTIGAIRLYEVDDCHYLDIPKWRDHQKIDKPTPSKLPSFVDSSRGLGDSSRKIAWEGKGRDQGREGNGGELVRALEDDIGSPSSLDPGQVTDADHWRMATQFETWVRALKTALAKIGPQNWRQWEALVTAHGIDVVTGAAKGIPAAERWPDRVSDVLAASRGQANPGDVVKIHKVDL